MVGNLEALKRIYSPSLRGRGRGCVNRSLEERADFTSAFLSAFLRASAPLRFSPSTFFRIFRVFRGESSFQNTPYPSAAHPTPRHNNSSIRSDCRSLERPLITASFR